MLGPALHIGRALRVVQAARRATVGPGKCSAKFVEFKAERVAAALGEDFEDFCAGVVAPDILSPHALTLNLIGRRAAVGPVDPAVGAPVQAARERVRVLQSEAREMHLGITVGDVVVVFVGIKKQVGRVEDPRAAVAGQHARREVKAGEKRFVVREGSVAIFVLQDRDHIGTAHAARRWRWHAVKFRADVLIVACDGEAGRKRILEILHDPHPPTRVELEVDRLTDERLAGDEFDRIALRGNKPFYTFCRGEHLSLPREVLPAGFEAFHELLHLRRETRRLGGGLGDDGSHAHEKQAERGEGNQSVHHARIAFTTRPSTSVSR